ncbi:MAG: methyltransferase domain-containing protein [Flavobacteriales bacterium]|nr:MAG: methyltransferase domain-containing protein [Flavobacteriales bacterium]
MTIKTLSRPARTNTGPTAAEARSAAQRIAFGPIVFQACWIMRKTGLLQALDKSGDDGLDFGAMMETSGLSHYAVTVLVDMGLTSEVLWRKGERYGVTKTGYMLASDEMTIANMDFVGDVCYEGTMHLEEALRTGRPSGLKVFGEWPTVYQALKSLPEQVRRSWFAFDHYYSDRSFPEALPIVFEHRPKTLMDVGGNTGKWALACLRHDADVQLVVVDLPGQLREVERNITAAGHADRLRTVPSDMLDPNSTLPDGADVIWMSQFLDCFSEEEVVSILRKARAAMTKDTVLWIMETFIDRQEHEAAAFSLAATSLYFTAIANGNSRMYRAETFKPLVERAGLRVVEERDNVGLGHSLWKCMV